MIFENSSPKGILRQIMNNVPKKSLSRDSLCYQAGALKRTQLLSSPEKVESSNAITTFRLL